MNNQSKTKNELILELEEANSWINEYENCEIKRRAEEKEKSEKIKLLNMIAEMAPMSIYLNGMQPPRNIWSNNYVKRELKYSGEQMAKFRDPNTSLEFIHPDDIEKTTNPKLFDNCEISECEYRMYDNEGNIRHLLSRCMPYKRLADGSVDEIIGVGIDLTELKKKEKELAETQEKLKFALENEKLALEQELDKNKKALLNLTLHIAEKNEFLNKLRKELIDLYKAVDECFRNQLDNIITNLHQEMNSLAYWQQFDEKFILIDMNFKMKLVESCPSLTQMEIRICKLIKLDLSNKEISSILNTSLRTIETHKHNIRKKLNLMKEVNLNNFISKIK